MRDYTFKELVKLIFYIFKILKKYFLKFLSKLLLAIIEYFPLIAGLVAALYLRNLFSIPVLLICALLLIPWAEVITKADDYVFYGGDDKNGKR